MANEDLGILDKVHIVEKPSFASDNYYRENKQVLKRMIENQKLYVPGPGYVYGESEMSQRKMREVLFQWMRHITLHRGCEIDVLALACQLTDRYMVAEKTDKAVYQVVGAACFLIASKLKEYTSVSLERLRKYTAESHYLETFKKMETCVFNTLGGDVYGITTTDFIYPLISFLTKCNNHLIMMRHYAGQSFIKSFLNDEFEDITPCELAVGCIFGAYKYLYRYHTLEPDEAENAMKTLCDLLDVPLNYPIFIDTFRKITYYINDNPWDPLAQTFYEYIYTKEKETPPDVRDTDDEDLNNNIMEPDLVSEEDTFSEFEGII